MLSVHDCTESLTGYYVPFTNSNAIHSFSFQFTIDPDTEEILDKEWGELAVTFTDSVSRTYFFKDFGLHTFMQMVNSPSIGTFFNTRVKGHYEFEVY